MSEQKKSLVVRLTEEEHRLILERRKSDPVEFDMATIRPGMPAEEIQKALRVIGIEMQRKQAEVDALKSYVSEKAKTPEGTREILLEVGRALRA